MGLAVCCADVPLLLKPAKLCKSTKINYLQSASIKHHAGKQNIHPTHIRAPPVNYYLDAADY
jgi:hypothetical protein